MASNLEDRTPVKWPVARFTTALPTAISTMTEPSVPHPRTIRSFVMRAGRTTVGQQRALDTLGEQFLVPYQRQVLDVDALFSEQLKETPLVLEIGFGMGEATAAIATTLPNTRFLACEVHPPGVGALLARIDKGALNNLRLINHDAVEVLDHMLPAGCLDGVHIFFPDPWHKKRHHKRRLVQPEFVEKLVSKLRPGGYIHAATDWQDYAVQMLQTFSGQPRLRNQSTRSDGFSDKPSYRPLTKFENRGLRLGHGVWDLVFERRAD
jgi:tRNA (guanine-N7-)-methyltransferase